MADLQAEVRTIVRRGTYVTVLSLLACLIWAGRSHACGGFFCQFVPIDQAEEQIIFRQDGNLVTAVVLIRYVGQAEDFSWVVPVRGIPELSTGSDLVFGALELATRPQFFLETTGEPCPQPSPFDSVAAGPDGSVDEDRDDEVEILQSLSVGPFAIQVVSSEDPEAMVQWLTDNGYDLADRGRELITPYVEEGLNFVAVKLLQDRGVGDIQPLIMRYETDMPMIPIRLTAVATQPDLGVLVWLLGPARAVPLNYLHVTPNYTRLNWYFGTQGAYASYQGLITAAMNEAGGQGFATDYAGRDLDVLSQLPSRESFEGEMVRLAAISDDAQFVAALAGGFVFPQMKVIEILHRALPLPEGSGDFIYQVPELLRTAVTAEALAAARPAILIELNDGIIVPLAETLDVLDDGLYLTRMYTTLSAEEMTLDPCFSFNPDLSDQPLERRAKLDVACTLAGTRWVLTLGAGTGREGEVVIDGVGLPPNFSFGLPPTIDQEAVWRTETVDRSGPPQVRTQKQFDVVQVGTDAGGGLVLPLCGAGIGQCGAGTAAAMLLSMLWLRLMRSRR